MTSYTMRTQSKHRASLWTLVAMLSVGAAVALGFVAVVYHH